MPEETSDPLAMRAADSDRAAVADVLGNAYAEGRLTLDEYQSRLDQVMSSTTYGDLVPVILDLPVAPDALPVPVRRDLARTEATGVSPTYNTSAQPGMSHNVIAVFGQNERSDDVHLGGKAVVVAVFGQSTLDLTRASFSVQDVQIDMSAVFGEARLVVPSDAVVAVGVVPILGEVKPPSSLTPTLKTAQPPRIHVKGVALFGSVTIERAPAPPQRLLGGTER